jgi:hypothetical protein
MYNEAEEGRDFQHCEWEEQPDGYRERWRRSAARLLGDVLPLIRAHDDQEQQQRDRLLRAQAVRDAAESLFYDGDTDRPLEGYERVLDYADTIEFGGRPKTVWHAAARVARGGTDGS